MSDRSEDLKELKELTTHTPELMDSSKSLTEVVAPVELNDDEEALVPRRAAHVAPRNARALAPIAHADEDQLPTGFEVWRSELEHLEGMALLDALLAPHNAEACVQTLPVEDLHRHLFAIGLEDIDEVLALASVEQVKGILDMETWQGFSPSLERLDVWLSALMRAGDEVLYKHMQAMDDELLSWVLQKNAVAFVIEDPESFSPPDLPHFMSPNRDFCVAFPREEGDEAVHRFIDLYMDEQPQACITFLLGASAALPSALEEEAYRWRTVRMSERGFIERYEALEVYTPPSAEWRSTLPPLRINEELPPSRRWLAQVIAPDQRLDAAFAALSWEGALVVMEHLGYTANRMLSADAVELWDDEAQAKVLKRLRGALHISLELLNGPVADADRDAQLLERHYLSDLFKLGYEQTLKAAQPVCAVESALRRGDDPSGALLELPRLKPLADALLAPHPEGQRGAPLETLADCQLAREGALLIEDLVRVSRVSRAEHMISVLEGEGPGERLSELSSAEGVGLGAELLSAFGRHVLGLGSAGPLPRDAVAELLARLLGEGAEQGAASFVTWWREQSGQLDATPLAIIAELKEQVGERALSAVDPRFVPLLWVS